MNIYDSIKTGLQEAVEHAAGKKIAKEYHFDDIDVKAIREKLDLSQSEFAERFKLNLRSIQNWEQHRKTPSGSSLVLLKVIDKDPNAVINALHS